VEHVAKSGGTSSCMSSHSSTSSGGGSVVLSTSSVMRLRSRCDPLRDGCRLVDGSDMNRTPRPRRDAHRVLGAPPIRRGEVRRGSAADRRIRLHPRPSAGSSRSRASARTASGAEDLLQGVASARPGGERAGDAAATRADSTRRARPSSADTAPPGPVVTISLSRNSTSASGRAWASSLSERCVDLEARLCPHSATTRRSIGVAPVLVGSDAASTAPR
jgi:hypothetical protein